METNDAPLLCGTDADSLLTSSLRMGRITIFYCSFHHNIPMLIKQKYFTYCSLDMDIDCLFIVLSVIQYYPIYK